MPKADTSSITSRRALLAGAALMAPASLLPAIAPAAGEEPDPHPAWHRGWALLMDWCNTTERARDRDLAEFAEYDRLCELEGLIGHTPTRTLAGALAQLRVVAHWQLQSSGLSDHERAGLANAIATLERLAGEAQA